jgi:hypothetical protein
LPALLGDYQTVRDMYLSEPLLFEDVLTTVAALDSRINQHPSRIARAHFALRRPTRFRARIISLS